MEQPPPVRISIPLCGIILVILIIITIFWPEGGTTTTSTTSVLANQDPKECQFWGDPHVVTFDGARPSYYGEGEYWVVKSTSVSMQGRYRGTEFTHGLSALNTVVVGGPVLNNHTVEITTMEDGAGIYVDGVPVPSDWPLYFTIPGSDGAILTYNDQGEVIDEATADWDLNVVRLRIPAKRISVTVFRWTNYLDMKISMPPQPEGQDGSCGNFNGNTTDDAALAVWGRGAALVDDVDLMFMQKTPTVPHFTDMMEYMLTKCTGTMDDYARGMCASAYPVAYKSKTCRFSICYAANEFALEEFKDMQDWSE